MGCVTCDAKKAAKLALIKKQGVKTKSTPKGKQKTKTVGGIEYTWGG